MEEKSRTDIPLIDYFPTVICAEKHIYIFLVKGLMYLLNNKKKELKKKKGKRTRKNERHVVRVNEPEGNQKTNKQWPSETRLVHTASPIYPARSRS